MSATQPEQFGCGLLVDIGECIEKENYGDFGHTVNNGGQSSRSQTSRPNCHHEKTTRI